ncbi:hypothetical protein [Streptomyces sp. RerS4]|nr:hypothetical protein [Streptomyces sp. RerS4]
MVESEPVGMVVAGRTEPADDGPRGETRQPRWATTLMRDYY